MTRVVEGVGKETIHMLCYEQLYVYKSAIQRDLLKNTDIRLQMTTGAFLARAEMGNEPSFCLQRGSWLTRQMWTGESHKLYPRSSAT